MSAAAASCVRGASRGRSTHGRHVRLHSHEAKLQAARRWQRSPAFDEFRRQGQVVEHRIARLVQLGIRQARYFGRHKTLFQVLLAATVANLTLVAGQAARGISPAGLSAFLGAVLASLPRLPRLIRSLGRTSGPATTPFDAIMASPKGFVKMAVFRPHL